ALVDIDSGDRAELSADQVDTIGDEAGAVTNIEDMIPVPAFRRKDEIIRPGLRDLQREAGIGCRRIAAELPSTRFTHWSFSSPLLGNRRPDAPTSGSHKAVARAARMTQHSRKTQQM